jgi:hypothetical protein
MHSWNIFGAQMNHMHTQTHKIHHGPDLGEVTTFPLIVFSVISHGAAPKRQFSWDSQVKSLEIPKIKTPATLDTHNFLCRPPIELRSKTKL